MIELNKRYTWTTPAGTLSAYGIAQVVKHLQAQLLRGETWQKANASGLSHSYLPALPDEWEWRWIIERGDYSGTLPKRLARYFFKVHGIKCPDTFLQEVGSIARPHSSEAVSYSFDFVDEFNWRSGDFGDMGSCYWGSHESAREMLTSNGAMAIRFFNESKGFARAWVAPVSAYYVLFNGYGFPGNATLTVAKIMASWASLTYKRINLSNNGTTSDTLYINGGLGYAIGTQAEIADMTNHDFEWEEECHDTCENCGRCLNEDETYFGADDNTYCERCYDARFDRCNYCDETFYNDDLIIVNYERVCEGCLERHFMLCDECEEYAPNAEITYVESEEKAYCQSCLAARTPPPIGD